MIMITDKVEPSHQITLLDLRGSISVPGLQDFDAIRRQVRQIQAQKIAGNNDDTARLPGITARAPETAGGG
jgi:hypothetical protein